MSEDSLSDIRNETSESTFLYNGNKFRTTVDGLRLNRIVIQNEHFYNLISCAKTGPKGSFPKSTKNLSLTFMPPLVVSISI